MNKKKIVLILLAVAIIISGITVFALSDSAPTGFEIPQENENIKIDKVDDADFQTDNIAIAEKKTDLLYADISLPSQITKSAKDEELTQEAIYNRMLNSIDYFDTASIVYSYKSSRDNNVTKVNIDTDLRSHKAFQSRFEAFWDDKESFEDHVADGTKIYWYFNNSKSYLDFGPVAIRTPQEDEYLANTPRHYIGEEEYNMGMDVWLHRADLTNASLASYCLFPENYAFGYLTDFSCWEITGELDYLGRKCIEINGTVDGYYGEKFNNETFCMYVDEATGILLMLEGYNAEGEVENFVHVSEVFIDQPEITCANIETKINTDKYADYEFIE